MSIWELAVRLVIIGGLSILAFAVIEAMWDARTKRRNAIRDAKRRHPAGKAQSAGYQCPVCRNPWPLPITCDECADVLNALDKEASS